MLPRSFFMAVHVGKGGAGRDGRRQHFPGVPCPAARGPCTGCGKALTHTAEDGTPTSTRLAYSDHISVRFLAPYARVSAEALGSRAGPARPGAPTVGREPGGTGGITASGLAASRG